MNTFEIEQNNEILNLLETFITKKTTDFDVEETQAPLNSNTTEKKIDKTYTKEDYHSSSLQDLDLKTSDTFFTKKYISAIKSIIGDKTQWSSLSQYEKTKIQQQLDSLTKDEYEWKSRTKRTVHDPSHCTDLFPTQSIKFAELMQQYTIHSQTQRGYLNTFQYKMKIFLHGLATYLPKKDMPAFKIFEILTDKDIDNILETYIEFDWMFNDLVRLVLKKAHDNVFNDKVRRSTIYFNTISDTAFVVRRDNLNYEYEKFLALYIVNCAMQYLIENKKTDCDWPQLSQTFRRFLDKKRYLYDTDNNHWWLTHRDNSRTIINLLEECNLYQRVIKDTDTETTRMDSRNKIKTIIKYILPKEAANLNVKKTDLPRLVVPDKVTNYVLDEIIKPVVFGKGKVSRSDRLKDTLTIAQKKRFGVNEPFLNLLIYLYYLTPTNKNYKLFTDIELPFSLSGAITDVQRQLLELETTPALNVSTTRVYNVCKDFLLANKISIKPARTLLESCGITKIDLMVNSKKLEVGEEKLKISMSRSYLKTTIEIGKLYAGLPVYIRNTLCIRLRLYSREPYMSRTTGCFKSLLHEYTPLKLSLSGLKHLLLAYYKPSPALTEQFLKVAEVADKNKKNGAKMMYEFFDENPLMFTKVPSPLYFMNLHMQIKIAQSTGKTSTAIEIDQTASGVMFLAFIFRNKKIASVSNITNKEFHCPYTYCMNNFKEFYDSNMQNKNDKFLQFTINSRKLHKYALMCFCYGQTYTGRFDDFKARYISETGEIPTPEIIACLQEFSQQYSAFIDFLFPNLIKQVNILDKMIDIAVEEMSSIRIRTLEGEIIDYNFYKHRVHARGNYDPVTKSFSKYKSRSFSTTFEKNVDSEIQTEKSRRLISDTVAHKRKFLSYLIHSIDAAIMRRFIRVLKERTGYTINHLHDCVIIHPNYADAFFELVKETYSSHELYDMIETLVFDEFLNNISKERHPEMLDLKEKFLALSDDFRPLLGNLVPNHIYQYESG